LKSKTTISNQIDDCHRLTRQAEEYAYDRFYDESNAVWSRASEIAIKLLRDHPAGMFSDTEYRFLKSIINHITEED
jgi:hypothetical protein